MSLTGPISNPVTAAATKIYTNAIMTGVTYHATQPTHPDVGAVYFDTTSGVGYIFEGTKWVPFSGTPGAPPKVLVPTPEQLEKYPALKQAWEEYMVIWKLLGL